MPERESECVVPSHPAARLIISARDEDDRDVAYQADLWDIKTAKLLTTIKLRPRQGFVPGLYHVSDKTLVVLGRDELGSSYDLETGKEIGTFKGDYRTYIASLSRDGKRLLTAGNKNELLVWDVLKPGKPKSLPVHAAKVESVAISSDGRYCAAAAVSGPRTASLTVFDRDKGEIIAWTSLALSSCRNGLLFTPDGKSLVVAGSGLNHGLAVWDWQEYKQQRGGSPRDLKAYRKAVKENPEQQGVQQSPTLTTDGRWLLTVGRGEARFWDLRPPAELKMPRER